LYVHILWQTIPQKHDVQLNQEARNFPSLCSLYLLINHFGHTRAMATPNMNFKITFALDISRSTVGAPIRADASAIEQLAAGWTLERGRYNCSPLEQ
jgi:hypothetical protein